MTACRQLPVVNTELKAATTKLEGGLAAGLVDGY